MNIRQAFAYSLRAFRQHKGATQEDFSEVSSQTYISQLEQGKKSPTLDKLVGIAKPLGVHPISLLALAFIHTDDESDLEEILVRVRDEVLQCCATKA